jgi:GDP-L-fucose synthase
MIWGWMMKNKKIVVTGGTGFVGKHVIQELVGRGYTYCVPLGSQDFDLTGQWDVLNMYANLKPDIIIHLAAKVGGIGANQASPGKFFHDNMTMGLNVIEQGRLFNVEKIVFVGTICEYPKYTSIPFDEENLWAGYPEETNAPYGIAKKALGVMLQGYYDEYDLKSSWNCRRNGKSKASYTN